MQLRPYQSAAVNNCRDSFEKNQSTLIVMPTGTGKTVVFSELVKRNHGRAIVLAHREELIYQAASKIETICGYRPSIEMAEMKSNESIGGGLFKNNCVVASVQTLAAKWGNSKRRNKFNPHDFSLLIIDEAHHAVSKSYVDTINHFKQNPNIRICGVSATPDRSDKLALGSVFDDVAFSYEIQQAIEDGWLVPIMSNQVFVESLDFDGVRRTAGDFNKADLARIVEQEENLHGIVGPTIEIAKDRKTLVFATTVAQAHDICAILNRYGKKAAFIHGSTNKETRREIIKRYSTGDYQFLCNVGIATEGFDDPGIEVVSIARPTLSRSLFCQMAGRGTRVLPGVLDGIESASDRKFAISMSDKPNVEIIDFVGNSSRHRLATSADILGGKYPTDIVDRASSMAQKEEGPVDLIELMEKASREQEEEQAAMGISMAGDAGGLKMKASYVQKKGDPFEVMGIQPHRLMKKRKVLTPNQQRSLNQSGISTDGLTNHQMSVLHDEVIHRRKSGKCTYKQAKILKRFGYRTDMSFQQANATITRLADNGWRRV